MRSVELNNIWKEVIEIISKRDDMAVTQVVNPVGLKLKPSLISVIGYILCWPVFLAFYFLPAGDGPYCLPVSSMTIITIGLCISTGFQLLIGYIAKGMFKPLLKFISEHHRKRIVHKLFDMMLRMIQFGLCFWIVMSQKQSVLKATVALD